MSISGDVFGEYCECILVWLIEKLCLIVILYNLKCTHFNIW